MLSTITVDVLLRAIYVNWQSEKKFSVQMKNFIKTVAYNEYERVTVVAGAKCKVEMSQNVTEILSSLERHMCKESTLREHYF